MNCAALAHAIISAPDWLVAAGILFVAAIFGASVMCLYYECRYSSGIAHQKRHEDIDAAFDSERI